MKNFIIIIFALISINISYSQAAISKFTSIEFTVYGVCGECEQRIEGALDIVGVKTAEWDNKTGIISIVYNTKKLKEEDLHHLIAAVGHRTDKLKADEKAYSLLPDCCKYDDGVEKH